MPRQEASADLPQGLVGGSGERSFIDSSQNNFLHFRRERKLPDS